MYRYIVFFLCHTVDKKYIFSSLVFFFFYLVFTLLVDLFDLLRTSFIRKKCLKKILQQVLTYVYINNNICFLDSNKRKSILFTIVQLLL